MCEYVCVCVCECAQVYFPMHLRVALSVCVLSVGIRVIQYPYRGQCLLCLLPQTQNHYEEMKNELKNNRRKTE